MFKNRISYKQMAQTLSVPNTEFLYSKLLENGYVDVIAELYRAHSAGDTRITDNDNIYLLYTDICGSDIGKFAFKALSFASDKGQIIATVYQMEDYIDALKERLAHERNTFNCKSIGSLKENISSYLDNAINSLSRSTVMRLNDEERETFYLYAKGNIDKI